MTQPAEAPLSHEEITDILGVDRPPRRRWPWILAILGLLAVVGALAVQASNNGQWVYSTTEATHGALVRTVTAVGYLEPRHTVEVGSELSGIVREVLVSANDPVVEGQVLVELDTTILAAQVRQARAQVAASEAAVAQAQVAVATAERGLVRATYLDEHNTIPVATLEDARSALEQADAALVLSQAQLAQARSARDIASTTLDKAAIVSPIDGVILERNIDPGQAVVSAFQAATLFSIAQDLTAMTVRVELDEADVGRVVPGQLATFTVAAYPERVFEAVVHKVHLAPQATSQIVAYEAELHLDNPEGLLLPGMTATAIITTDEIPEALLVPNAALRFTPAGSEDLPPPASQEGRTVTRLWVLVDESPEPIEVIPGLTDGTRTIIDSGALQPGDPVVTEAKPRRARGG